jgi:hypothetical protein
MAKRTRSRGHVHPTDLSQRQRRALGVDQLANAVRDAVATDTSDVGAIESQPAAGVLEIVSPRPADQHVWFDIDSGLVHFTCPKSVSFPHRSLSDEFLSKAANFEFSPNRDGSTHIRVLDGANNAILGLYCVEQNERIIRSVIDQARANYRKRYVPCAEHLGHVPVVLRAGRIITSHKPAPKIKSPKRGTLPTGSVLDKLGKH